MQAGGNTFPFVGGVLVVYVLVLDLLPQSFIQPYLSGRELDMVLLLFAYILGPILFGWYGFFFLPIVVVLVFEAARIVLPELLRGVPLRPEPSLAEDVGSHPQEKRDDTPDSTDVGSDSEAETDPDSDGADTGSGGSSASGGHPDAS
jgi:hypothetical protein